MRSRAGWTLAVLTALNFVNYVDRWTLAAVQEQMRLAPGFAGVSDAQLGILQSAFLWVYMCAAPVAGIAGRRVPRKWLVFGGVAVWSVATVASGLVASYGQMFLARAVIGFGEAGYATVAPAMLSDLYPRARRNLALSIFYLAIPVGSAMGFVLAGQVAQHFGWRHAFFVAGGPGLALAVAALALPEPPRGATDEEGAMKLPLADGLRAMGRAAFVYLTLGMALMTFTIGGLAAWMPSYFQVVRKLSVGDANTLFGGIAVVAGIVGTALGSAGGDAFERRRAGGYLRFSGWGLVAAAPFALATPLVGSLKLAFACAFLAELLIFLNTGPLNTALVNAVPPGVRELAVGVNVLATHALGDAVSPTLLGAISDGLRRRGASAELALSLAVAATAAPLLAGGALLLQGARVAARKTSAG